MVTVDEIRNSQRSNGPATILALGIANPSNYVCQANYPDYYFRVTNSDHMIDLKDKFKRICERSMIKKRHMYLTEDILKENPNISSNTAPSLNIRLNTLVEEVPKLGKEAAMKAINEWGQPKSKITHLVFCTSSAFDMPGVDYQLTKLLGLHPSIKRLAMYLHGCNAGGTVIRVAKDLAENNKGARVLVVCSEMNMLLFHGPSENCVDTLVGQALFGDGAGAMIIGSDPNTTVERPIFQIVSALQTLLPDSEGAIKVPIREEGMVVHLLKDVPKIISENFEKIVVEAFTPIGINDWNSIFWAVHPGGRAILDQVEAKLGLKEGKLQVSRHILSEYGNMASSCLVFVLDEMRKKSLKDGKATTGEGLKWGVLVGFGPGITVETVVLHSVPIEACR